jgi:5-methylcytosine-specific restriction endonuclease McrA
MPEERAARRRRIKERPDVVRAEKRRYYEKHRERIKADAAAYAHAHPEQVIAASRSWYQRNKVITVARAAAWAASHPDDVKRFRSKWKRAHPEISVLYSHQRRARAAAVSHTLTVVEWRETLEYFDHMCAYCLKPLRRGAKGGPNTLTQDHVIAITRGGGHTQDNVVPACWSCNARKHNGPVFLMAKHIA